jgi:hypothetical protein
MPTLADRVLIDHAPAPALLGEEARGHRSDDPVLVGTVIDPVRVHGPTVAPGGFRGTGAIPVGPWANRQNRREPCVTIQTKEVMEMPKVSRDSAPQRQDAGPMVDLRDELDGYTVSFTSLLEDIDATPLMEGLPDDRCQCPHWGYVFKGKMTARYADHDEVFEAGDAFYTPPGHVPVKNEPGTEFVWFSPSEELRTAEAAMIKNMQSMQDGATP